MQQLFLPPKRIGLRLIILAALAAMAYAPAQLLPLISDDYIQIQLARTFGSDGWRSLANDVLYRSRATSLLLTYWTEQVFGLVPLAFKLSSLAIHVLNVFLVLALGSWRAVGYRVSAFAAAFFAIAEGHQEAVIWYAALPELLVFTFTLLALLCWIQFVQSPGNHQGWYTLSVISFALGLASKESAVVLVALQLLVIAMEKERRRSRLLWLAPFGIASCLYFAGIYAGRTDHLHFNDGTFSIHAPFLHTISNSVGRMLWIWGYLAIVVILIWRKDVSLRVPAIAFAWMALALLPYAFLTYMPRVPSRHTYLPSVGLALLVAAGMGPLIRRSRPWAGVAVMAMLAHNYGYLWTYKHRQFAERAAPTEELIRFARRNPGKVYVHCFPYNTHAAQTALHVGLNLPLETVVWAVPSSGCDSRVELSTGSPLDAVASAARADDSSE